MGHYRSDFQKQQDRAEIARMVGEDRQQNEIAKELGLSPQLVSKEVKAMKEEWRRSAFSDIADQKAQELARLNWMERNLWEAWELSTQGQKRTQQWAVLDTPTAENPNPKPVPRRVCVTTENEPCDLRIMKAILAIVQQRCKLLDLYQPIPAYMVTDDRLDPSKMTIEQRAERAMELLREYGGVTPPANPD